MGVCELRYVIYIYILFSLCSAGSLQKEADLQPFLGCIYCGAFKTDVKDEAGRQALLCLNLKAAQGYDGIA